MLNVTRMRLLALGVGAAWLSGCVVPQDRYDEAVNRLDRERAAAREAEQQLASIRERLKKAEALVALQHRDLETREEALARTQVDVERASTDRNDAAVLVEQLRGELARAGDHLRFFSDQKKQLEAALEAAGERADEIAKVEREIEVRAVVVRDLCFALHEPVQHDEATLDVKGTDTVMRLPASAVFAGENPGIQKKGAALLVRIAKAVAPHEPARVEVTLHPASPDYRPENVVVQLQRVADLFNATGVAFERVTLSLPQEKNESDATDRPSPSASVSKNGGWQTGPGSLELVIRVNDSGSTDERQP